MFGVLVHGGAGGFRPERYPAAELGCRRAALVGLAVLERGGRALDAVQAAVEDLEDDPEFNAGVGGLMTRDQTFELDASIMDGDGLRVGAVAAVPNLRRPVRLARAVLDDGEHVLLAGAAAWQFARERGFAPCQHGELLTERAIRRWNEEAARRHHGGAPPAKEGGTVGAVAIDGDGHVAAATSTGGTNWKRPGRVGDSPLPGAGTWADDRSAAASATGDGEAIIRVSMTRQICDRIAAGVTPAEAVRAVLAELVQRTGGSAGVIVVDPRAGFVAGHVSDIMPVGLAIRDQAGRRAGAWIHSDGVDLVSGAAPVVEG